MRLTDQERAMRQGEHGEPRRWAIEQQIAVGAFFDAEDFVAVDEVHVCADGEALGESGVAFLESLGTAPAAERAIRVPGITDPRGTDFCRARDLGHSAVVVDLERRLADALRALGFMLTDTCITYQCVSPPVRGAHLAYGDTGTVIHANSVEGAHSNFEGGPAAIAAGLTGRTPRYGYHLARHRRGTRVFELTDTPRTLSEWGTLGALVGRAMGSYWEVPVLMVPGGPPSPDGLKHLGAALASYGSTAMFHLVGVTPEAPSLEAACGGPPPAPQRLGRTDLDGFLDGFPTETDDLDVVVFAAPQLSLVEMRMLADLLDGQRVHEGTALLATTAPAVKVVCDASGISERIEAAGGKVLSGMCFYQSHAREMAAANGWRTLMSNSAKLVNIIAGYGYQPVLASMRRCVDSAVAGRIQR